MGRWNQPALYCALVLAVFASCCAGRATRKDRKTAADSAAAQAEAEAATLAIGDEVEVQEASLRGKDFMPIPELQTLYFEYDKSNLEESARKTLQKNAEWLRSNPDIEIKIAGHCDDRGTSEYNLALGQLRAVSARDYYKALGIRMERMGTFSFGEEMPVCKESTEECWQRNRRVETLVKRR